MKSNNTSKKKLCLTQKGWETHWSEILGYFFTRFCNIRNTFSTRHWANQELNAITGWGSCLLRENVFRQSQTSACAQNAAPPQTHSMVTEAPRALACLRGKHKVQQLRVGSQSSICARSSPFLPTISLGSSSVLWKVLVTKDSNATA